MSLRDLSSFLADAATSVPDRPSSVAVPGWGRFKHTGDGSLERWGVPSARVGVANRGLGDVRRLPAGLPSGLSGVGLGRLAALGEQPLVVQIPGIPRPVSGPLPDPATFRRVPLAPGQRGTTETLEAMADLAVEAARDPWFVTFARNEVRHCAARDHLCVADAILQWVKQKVKYVYDPVFAEWLQSPGWTAFVEGAGDCDDGSSLIAAMAGANGLQSAFRAVAVDRSKPKEFSHVFPLIEIPGRGWLAADFVPQVARLGWEPPRSEWLMPPNDLLVEAA